MPKIDIPLPIRYLYPPQRVGRYLCICFLIEYWYIAWSTLYTTGTALLKTVQVGKSRVPGK